MYNLSIIILGRNEEFMGKTIEDVLEHTSEVTEVIAVLDGYRPDPPLTQVNPRVTIIYNPESVGQRAACNQGIRLSKAKYVCKLDAHCSLALGFDVEMIKAMEELGDDTTLIPMMKNLHAFDWVCPDGHRRYQGPSGPCKEKGCGKPTTKDIVWIAKNNPTSKAYRFDKTMHFQYWGEWARRQKGDYTETMSIQGSCFMADRQKYLELDLTSEEFNSWGQNGVEVACKTWLSGGKVIVNRKTWYAHLFRTQGGDFGFPYTNPQSKVVENREKTKELFQKDNWPLAKHKFQWLLDKFNPPDWTITKGIIYYTDNQLDEEIATKVRHQIQRIGDRKGIAITSSSLKKMEFGVKNVRFPSMKRGYLTMFKQILGALENTSDNIIFFTEHDVLYHPSHFDFTPPEKDVFYYNQNVWLVRMPDGHGLHYDVNQLSGLCVYKEAAITHFRERFEMAEAEYKRLESLFPNKEEHTRMFNRFIRKMGFEPFTHGRIKWKNEFKHGTWKSEYPNIDLKHGANATGQRWKKEQYRNQQLLINWTESNDIPGWGTLDHFWKKLK